ncbi:uncharacterized protein B4 [Halyomorpha halys]|uniref:uncharacterized protein B4 n=1 Tax=Halyomorpha halys TaxID=286706 RepID=UPI0006D51EAE|nr:uncharacterized protein LOC106683123 [Halyomorpha halys]
MTVSSNNDGEEALTPRQFLKRYSLPRCAQVVPSCGDVSLLGQKVLLYKYYRTNRVEAALEDNDGGTLVIPQVYDGWFSVVTERGQIKAKCYTIIQRLISSQISSFLTIADLIAYTLNDRNSIGKKQHYCKITIKGGQVLKLLAVYEDVGNNSPTKKSTSSNLDNHRYAQCLTQSDQVIYVPISTTGQFYATACNRRDDSVQKVYQLTRLLKTFPLPVRVCIVNGCKAQGSMVLEMYKTEEVILACCLGREKKLLEIDINSKFLIVDDQIKTTDHDIKSALQYTRLNWDSWRGQPKIAHYIYKKTHQKEKSYSDALPNSNVDISKCIVELPYVEVKDSIEEAVYAEITS